MKYVNFPKSKIFVFFWFTLVGLIWSVWCSLVWSIIHHPSIFIHYPSSIIHHPSSSSIFHNSSSSIFHFYRTKNKYTVECCYKKSVFLRAPLILNCFIFSETFWLAGNSLQDKKFNYRTLN